jgi:hypothetical protein
MSPEEKSGEDVHSNQLALRRPKPYLAVKDSFTRPAIDPPCNRENVGKGVMHQVVRTWQGRAVNKSPKSESRRDMGSGVPR